MRELWISACACLLSFAACERSGTQSPDEAAQGGDTDTKPDAIVERGPVVAQESADGAEHEKLAKGSETRDPNATCHVDIAAATETMVGRYPSLEIRVDPPIQHHGGPTPALHVQVISPSGDMREQDYPLIGQSTCAFCLPAPGSGGCNHSCTYEPYSFEETSFGRMIKVPGIHQIRFSLRNLECALNLSESKIDVAPKALEP